MSTPPTPPQPSIVRDGSRVTDWTAVTRAADPQPGPDTADDLIGGPDGVAARTQRRLAEIAAAETAQARQDRLAGDHAVITPNGALQCVHGVDNGQGGTTGCTWSMGATDDTDQMVRAWGVHGAYNHGIDGPLRWNPEECTVVGDVVPAAETAEPTPEPYRAVGQVVTRATLASLPSGTKVAPIRDVEPTGRVRRAEDIVAHDARQYMIVYLPEGS